MKKYMALYLAPVADLEEVMKHATPETKKQGMDAWMNWSKSAGSALVEMGSPLGKNKHISKSGVADTRNDVCGYSIVQADSHDAAAKLFEGHPHLSMMPGASIDVIECMDMATM